MFELPDTVIGLMMMKVDKLSFASSDRRREISREREFFVPVANYGVHCIAKIMHDSRLNSTVVNSIASEKTRNRIRNPYAVESVT